MMNQTEHAPNSKTTSPKQKLLIALAVLIVLAGVGFGGWKYYQFCDSVDYVVSRLSDIYVKDFEGEEEWWYDDYLEVCDSRRFAKKMNAALDTMLYPADTTESPSYTQFFHTVKILDLLNWQNADTKAAADAACIAVKDSYLQAENGLKNLLNVLAPLKDMQYYPAMTDIVTADDAAAFMAPRKRTMQNEGTLKSLKQYMTDVSAILKYRDDWTAEDFLTANEILDLVTQHTEPAIFENNKGGFYDGNHKKNSSSKDSLHYTHTHSYSYYGDFMTHSSSKKAYRPTGEAWENQLLSKYDSSSSSLYYKGEQLSASISVFQTLISGGTTLTKYSASASGGDTAVAADSYYGNGTAQVLGVLVNAEEDFICVVKDDGIALVGGAIELAYDKVSTEGYHMTPASERDILIEKNAPAAEGEATAFETGDIYKQMASIMTDAFKEFSPEVRFDRANNRIVLLVTAPPGTATALEQGLSSDAWNQFCQALADMAESGRTICTQEGFDIEFVAAVISDADEHTILYGVCNGKEASVSFNDSSAEDVPAEDALAE